MNTSKMELGTNEIKNVCGGGLWDEKIENWKLRAKKIFLLSQPADYRTGKQYIGGENCASVSYRI